MAEPRRFEIGLVMAGAVSAGAYTAGVVDFLLQALDTWQEARNRGAPGVPPHQVRIKVLSGASAGGMTAALAASIVGSGLEPVTEVPPPGPVHNKLYESWVERIDMRRLLEGQDLAAPDAQVVSVLDGTALDEIADYAFSDGASPKQRPYFDDNVHVLMSVTNLRGVPYSIGFVGDRSRNHELSMHADHMHFVVSKEEQQPPVVGLDPSDLGSDGWALLKDTALATGAFPLGLPARLLRRRLEDYAHLKWQVPLAASEESGLLCQEEIEIPPHWPRSLDEDGEYVFLCVDGGLMDNEPLELARRILSGGEQRNPREGTRADRAVLMIDPFPNSAPFRSYYRPDDRLTAVLGQMFSSMRYQACFKPDELALAYARDVYSRFLIAPSRPTAANQHPLACGSLGAFGGFLSKHFRQHDFQLGRRNCQAFLQRYFVLPDSNPLFDDWTDEMRTAYRRQEDCLPIIPLIGELNDVRIERLEWPTISDAELAEIKQLVGQRADLLVQRLLPRGSAIWLAARMVWRLWLRRKAVNRVMAMIRDDLLQNQLWRPAEREEISEPAP